jgi:hypothetical protein
LIPIRDSAKIKKVNGTVCKSILSSGFAANTPEKNTRPIYSIIVEVENIIKLDLG